MSRPSWLGALALLVAICPSALFADDDQRPPRLRAAGVADDTSASGGQGGVALVQPERPQTIVVRQRPRGGQPQLLQGSPFAPDDPRQDLLLLDERGPILVRLMMTIDGEPFRQARARYTASLFEQADADADGRLTIDEAMANAGLLMGNRGGFSAVNIAVQNEDQRRRIEDAYRNMFDPDGDGEVSDRELAGLVSRFSGGAEFGVSFRPGQAAVGEALYDAIDSDGDGRLSAAELAEAEANLDHLDADDNDLLVPQEIAGQPGYGGATGVQVVQSGVGARRRTVQAGTTVLVGPNGSPERVATALLAAYDADADDILSAAEFGRRSDRLRADAFAALDADGSGSLDVEELAEYAQREPDWTLAVAFGAAEPDAPAVALLGAAEEPQQTPADEGADEDQLVLATDTLRLEVVRIDDASADYAERTAGQQMQFLDGDSNGYLEREETSRAAYLQSAFDELDADGDGKLFPEELVVFFERQYAPRRTRISLVATEHGRSLFEMLDRDSDGRLSLRELREAPESLGRFDADGDGCLTRAEVPSRTTWQLTRGLGGAYAAGGNVVVVQQGRAGGRPQAADAAEGPEWFVRMDRNGDGDLTPREFLGTPDLFERLDTDGDGFIDPEEAEAVMSDRRE